MRKIIVMFFLLSPLSLHAADIYIPIGFGYSFLSESAAIDDSRGQMYLHSFDIDLGAAYYFNDMFGVFAHGTFYMPLSINTKIDDIYNTDINDFNIIYSLLLGAAFKIPIGYHFIQIGAGLEFHTKKLAGDYDRYDENSNARMLYSYKYSSVDSIGFGAGLNLNFTMELPNGAFITMGAIFVYAFISSANYYINKEVGLHYTDGHHWEKSFRGINFHPYFAYTIYLDK